MKKPIHAILKEASDKATEAERIAVLQAYNTPTLQSVLAHALDPNIVFDLPPGSPPVEREDTEYDQFGLYREARKFYIFVKWERQPEMHKMKRERLFIDLLGALDPAEANVVVNMKDKVLPYPNLTIELVRKAFPGLIP